MSIFLQVCPAAGRLLKRIVTVHMQCMNEHVLQLAITLCYIWRQIQVITIICVCVCVLFSINIIPVCNKERNKLVPEYIKWLVMVKNISWLVTVIHFTNTFRFTFHDHCITQLRNRLTSKVNQAFQNFYSMRHCL